MTVKSAYHLFWSILISSSHCESVVLCVSAYLFLLISRALMKFLSETIVLQASKFSNAIETSSYSIDLQIWRSYQSPDYSEILIPCMRAVRLSNSMLAYYCSRVDTFMKLILKSVKNYPLLQNTIFLASSVVRLP